MEENQAFESQLDIGIGGGAELLSPVKIMTVLGVCRNIPLIV